MFARDGSLCDCVLSKCKGAQISSFAWEIREMQEILSKPALKHKFVKGLEDRPNIKIYRKSGTWKNWHADSGVVVHKNYKYIIVALSRIADGGEKLSRLATAVDDLMERRHTSS
jgi:beta-lactamase class A